MSHFAEIKDGIVQQVIVADQDFIDSGAVSGTWVQTSYNTYAGQHPEGRPLRKNYAGIGFAYDAVRDAFIPPQPFSSWILDESTCQWQPPTPMPVNDNVYIWSEEEKNWIVVSREEI